MMNKFLAGCFLIVAGMFNMLGNLWFTYGMWPRSWMSFILFGSLSITLNAMWLFKDRNKS